MYIIRVVPLSALPAHAPQVFDYFWSNPLSRGSVVRVAIGHRTVCAIVLESLDVARQKISIKKATFELKKISSIVTEQPQATEHQLRLANWIAVQYASGLSVATKTVLPLCSGAHTSLIKILPRQKTEIDGKPPIPDIILSEPNTTIKHISNILASTSGQILLLVPEVALTEYFAERYAKYHPMIMHSGLGIRRQRVIQQAVADGSCQLIIGTRGALFLPWNSLTHIIIEDPQHEAYKSDMSPRIATADVARHLATLHHAQFTILSPALTAVHRYLIDRDSATITDSKPHWPHIVATPMIAERQSGNRSLFARKIQDELLDAYDHDERVLFYSGRRAYATSAACTTCHRAVMCPTCDIPLRYHRTRLAENAREDMLVCYRCAGYQTVPAHCPACRTGTLCPSGRAGSQKIADAVYSFLDYHGHAPFRLPILDSDLVRTDSDSREILSSVEQNKKPWLVATQMILGQRYRQSFDRICVVNADTLISHVDFRTQERLIWQLEKLADLKPRTMYLQYWNEQNIVNHASDRSWNAWLAGELKERKALGWPPYVRIIKVTHRHANRTTALRLATLTADRLSRAIAHLGWSQRAKIMGPTPALVAHDRGQWIQHIIIKTTLTGDDAMRVLSYAPAGGSIDVDPRSIA